jgi:hypothetical protein
MGAKRSYASKKQGDKQEPYMTLGLEIGRYFLWLRQLFLNQLVLADVKVEGISIRFDYLSVLVVVRGLHLVSVRHVVVFGRGEHLYIALRNVTLAIEKAQWKVDKYRGLLP